MKTILSGPHDKSIGRAAQTTPEQCPRFDHCSANICPLDPDWRLRNHLKGERSCAFLREVIKPGGRARLRGIVPREIAEKVSEVLPDVLSRYGHLRRALRRAAKRPSRLGRRVAGEKGGRVAT